MLTAVDVINALGDTLTLSLLSPDNGYQVREIGGLDPVNATLTTSTLAQVDGAQAQNARRETRNITIKLGLEPDFAVSTVASLRSALYNYLMPKAYVSFGFYIDDVLTYTATGQVESFENSMFSADPEVDISVMCYDPDFYATEATVVTGDTVDGTLEVPIDYEGTSEAGFIFEMTLDHDLPDGFAIYNTPPVAAYQGLIINAPLVIGDTITINTIPGQKAMTLNRGGIDTSLLYGLGTGAVWLIFLRGTNYFRAYADDDPISYTISYVAKYGGI
jgi:hypothetical protein